MRDLHVLKMQIERDEQETVEEFIEDMVDMCEGILGEEKDELGDRFRGPSYKVRYQLPNPLFEEDD